VTQAMEIAAETPAVWIRRFEVRMASGELNGEGLLNAVRWLENYAVVHHYPDAVPARTAAEIEALRRQYVRTT